MNKRLIIQSLIPLVLAIGINCLFPITFTAYFLLCALGLLASVFWNSRITCWSIITTASILVTINYLRPSADVYNNAAHHVIALKGMEKQGTITLVNSSEPKKALNDGDQYNGYLFAKSGSNGNNIEIREKLSSQPIYIYDKTIGDEGAYRLLNGENLIRFTKNIKVSVGNHSVSLSLRNDADTLNCTAEFVTDSTRVVNLAFNKKIKEGYPIVDLLRSGGNCTATEEDVLSYIKDVYIVREILSSDHISDDLWYVTITPMLYSALNQRKVIISCDNKNFSYALNEKKHVLNEGQKMYWGVGSSKSRAISFSGLEGDGIEMNYDMPIMYNFPADSLGCCNKIAAISSSSDDLLSSEIKEAFFFDMFTKRGNEFNFNGTISYQTAASPAPLSVNILDANQDKGKKVIASTNNSNHFQLTTKRGHAKWNVSIVNLREISPINEMSNPFISEWLLIGIILGVCFFTILTLVIFSDGGLNTYKATSVFNIWSFFVPMITLRLYLLWRIAVFPPTTDITKAEFLRYRMENGMTQNAMVLTLFCIGVLMLLTIVLCFYEKVMKQKSLAISLTAKQGLYVYVTSLVVAVASLFSGLVLGNIMMPVLVFFINEYICLKYLKLPYRILNTLVVMALLVKGDPGYAIMFVIFASVYFIIQTVVFRNSESTDRAERNAAWKLCLILSVLVGAIIIFAPQLVACLFDKSFIINIYLPIKLLNVIHSIPFCSSFPSVLYFSIIIAVTITCISLVVIRLIDIYYGRKTARTSIFIALIFIPIASLVFVPVLNSNKHIKYRSLIHTQDVGQIMINENVAERDNQRLLEASQNQWFLQYHSNLGEDRIFDDGILHIYPHFKKGVSWNTQISDVICSRYIIGELSLIVPLAMICFIIVFLLFSLKHATESPVGKSMSYGIALLFLIQTTFVWMANTNRMIFFGQDFPFMSQNARITMLMFCLLLFMMMCSSGRNESDDSVVESRLSNNGFDYFNHKPLKSFMVLFFAVFGVVFMFGNKYSSLYHTDKATAFNAGEAMMQAEKDLDKINAHLAIFTAKKELKPNGENLTKLFDEINNAIGIDSYVKTLEDNGEIQPFSASLYHAFRNNLQLDNRIDNIIHLQYISAANAYKFALNNGFYSLRAPEMQKMLWSGNVYAYDDKHDMDNLLVSSGSTDKIDIYRIPRSWLMDDSQDIGIADVRYTRGDCDIILRSPLCDYAINEAKVFVLNLDECIETKIGNTIYLDQLSGRKEKLMAKNMIVNGQNRFFYPMGKSLFWIKDFSELLASQSYDDKNKNCELTLDKDLLENVYDVLDETKKTCSVVALDGSGNVRLMAEYNSREEYNLDPNNTIAIERFVEQSYLNPNYSEDSKIFGNQNLVYMLPGPGSSLKPITYAAVTSQTTFVDWASLRLHAPSSEYLSSGDYLMKEFGPDYKYLDEPFTSPSSDESGEKNSGWVDNNFYLYQSSNYYNALITYFGNYENGDLKKLSNIIESTNDYTQYPIFELNGQTYRFKNSPYKYRQNGVLNIGLRKNFKMKVALDAIDSTRFVSNEWLRNVKAANHPWVFPAASNAYFQQMRDLPSEALRLKQYTLGSSPLCITPLMMAEMYGRLYSMHPDYYACITKNTNEHKEKWDVPEAMNQQTMFDFYKNNLFRGMANCVSKGTASDILSSVDKKGKYYLYAKTGTLKLSKKMKNDRMLAVIITNQDISQVSSPKDYKFYVVYFRFKQTGSMYNVSKIINQIIESKSFSTYMNT